jgi:hypothetical protein
MDQGSEAPEAATQLEVMSVVLRQRFPICGIHCWVCQAQMESTMGRPVAAMALDMVV